MIKIQVSLTTAKKVLVNNLQGVLVVVLANLMICLNVSILGLLVQLDK